MPVSIPKNLQGENAAQLTDALQIIEDALNNNPNIYVVYPNSTIKGSFKNRDLIFAITSSGDLQVYYYTGKALEQLSFAGLAGQISDSQLPDDFTNIGNSFPDLQDETFAIEQILVDIINDLGKSIGGVTSLNSLIGAITLIAGSNIRLTTIGNSITLSSSGGGEILVADGYSNPPIMLTNEAQDDFVYEG